MMRHDITVDSCNLHYRLRRNLTGVIPGLMAPTAFSSDVNATETPNLTKPKVVVPEKIPDIDTNCETLNKITSDKSRHLMFYCNGLRCGRSVISLKIARSCGYHHLSWFKGGFSEWTEKGYQYIKPR